MWPALVLVRREATVWLLLVPVLGIKIHHFFFLITGSFEISCITFTCDFTIFHERNPLNLVLM